jgi:hypothetical protein
LQERLKELHSDRDSPDYDGTKPDVLRVKLDSLRSLTPAEALSPRHLEDDDDRVDDDDGDNDNDDDDNDDNDNDDNDNDDNGDDDDDNDDNDNDDNDNDDNDNDDNDNDDNDNDDNDNDDNDNGNDDDFNPAKDLFPFLLSYLDLSTLELKEKVPNRLPLPLLLRKEYKVISELIKKRPQASGGSVIVSGQPGTGQFLVSPSHRI